jgi:CubicO group peptidase (beta-lactamase class C family)
VLRHGQLVYERYFGRGNRDANPNMYSIGKMFTSVCCGILLAEHRDRFPDGLAQKVFTPEYLPEAFPLSDPRMAEIQLDNLLTMTSGLQEARVVPPGTEKSAIGGHQIGIVHGENVNVPYCAWPDSERDKFASQDGSALHGRMWTGPGEGYLYGRDPHIGSNFRELPQSKVTTKCYDRGCFGGIRKGKLLILIGCPSGIRTPIC